MDCELRKDVYAVREIAPQAYFRQCEAIAASTFAEDTNKLSVPVIAADNPLSKTTNAKKYFCMSVAEIVNYLKKRERFQWNLYEVILDHRPCHVYLDVEASLALNPDFNYEEMGERIKTEFRTWLSDHVCARFGEETFRWVELDASNVKKWSKHFIGVGEAMQNQYHVGAAVRRFEDYIVQKYGLHSEWFVFSARKNVDQPIRNFVIDTGVYTKNRLYRMALQVKCNQKRFMLPVSGEETPSVDLFMKSMVQPPGICETYGDHGKHSCFDVDRDGQALRYSNAVKNIKSPQRPMSDTGRQCPLNLYKILSTILNRELQISTCLQIKTHYYPDSFIVTFAATETYCYIKGADHKTPKMYINFNILEKTYTAKCFSTHCKSKLQQKHYFEKVTWTIPDYAAREIDKLMEEDSTSDLREPGYIYTRDIMQCIEYAKRLETMSVTKN